MNPTPKFAPARPKEKKRKTPTPARVLALHAIDAAIEKKAADIVVLDMRQVSGVADYFVICTGESDLQVKAIFETIEMRIKEVCQERPWHHEGTDHRQWVLIDYVDLVIHIFSPEKRAFYDLERLWGDAPLERVPEALSSAADLAMLQASSTP